MRLFWQVYLTSLAFVLFSMALLTTVVSYRDRAYSLASLRQEQRLLSVTAASQVEAGYHENIWPFGMLWAISGEPEFAFWEIVDSDGQSVLSDGALEPRPDADQGPPREPRWAAARGEGAADVEQWVVPLSVGSPAHPWVFRLGFRTERVRVQVWRTIATNVLVALGISLLLVGVAFVFTRRLLGPLQSLTDAARELERGNLTVALPTNKSDEIGRLMRAFGSMVASVKQRDDAIQRHVDSLQRARDSLEEREARLHAVIQHAADGIISVDERAVIEVFNPSAERMFGARSEEVIGRRLDSLFMSGYGLGDDGGLVDRTGPAPASLGWSAEIQGRRRDGTAFPLQIAVSEAYFGDARRLRTAIVRDISEEKRADAERREMHARLVQASRQAGMAEVATSVLHNVGNVLTSVNISAGVLSDTLRDSRAPGLGRACALLDAHADDLGAYLTSDPAGRLLPAYLGELASVLEAERETTRQELASLVKNINHIEAVVAQQQSYARTTAPVAEDVEVASLCDDALQICGADLAKHRIHVLREYAALPPVRADRHKVLQILVNLVSNAKHALLAKDGAERALVVRTGVDEQGMLSVRIVDNGVGIAPENLIRIFNYGFTTKKAGHGFGLHGSALAAEQLGGALRVESEGPGHGATFELRFPSRPKVSHSGREDRHEHAS